MTNPRVKLRRLGFIAGQVPFIVVLLAICLVIAPIRFIQWVFTRQRAGRRGRGRVRVHFTTHEGVDDIVDNGNGTDLNKGDSIGDIISNDGGDGGAGAAAATAAAATAAAAEKGGKGREDGGVRDIVLLLHGFPDGPDLWQRTVSRLTGAGYRCIVAALPGCLGQAVEEAPEFDGIVEQVHAAATAAALKEGMSSVSIVAHDWGSVIALELFRRYPDTAHRIAIVDAATMPKPELTNISCIAMYQILLALCYLVGHPFGTHVLRIWFYIFVRAFAPKTVPMRPVAELRSDMAWPYVSFWTTIVRRLGSKLLSQARKSRYAKAIGMEWNQMSTQTETEKSTEATTTTTATTGSDGIERRRKTSLFFVYGSNKPLMFHDEEFVARVRASPHGQVLELDCGHWVMLEKEPEWTSTLLKWMEISKLVVPRSKS